MPKPTYAKCRECGRHRNDVGELSHSRLCTECSTARLYANNLQIHHKRGPFYERRIYGMVQAELGPRVAMALKQSGVFAAVLDPPPESA